MKLRKILALSMLSLSLTSTPMLANTIDTTTNIGVTTEMPQLSVDNKILTYSTSKPTILYDIMAGQYNFNGQAAFQNLYTDRIFYGRTSYKLHVKNNYTEDLIIKVWKKGLIGASDIYTYVLSPQKGTLDTTISMEKATDKFYIEFSAPCIFEGYIK